MEIVSKEAQIRIKLELTVKVNFKILIKKRERARKKINTIAPTTF